MIAANNNVQYLLCLLALGLSTSVEGGEGALGSVEQPQPFNRALDERVHDSIRRAVDWLLRQQADDGGWHSATYGQMRGGAGNTALVVYALAHVPKPSDGVQASRVRGVQFLVSKLDEKGFVRAPDKSSDYPTYATALALIAMERMHVDQWRSERRRMRTYLHKAQKRDPAERAGLGGWGLTGGVTDQADAEDVASVSATRFALEALRASGGLDRETRLAALSFLHRCQNGGKDKRADGGFFFTPILGDPLNKAGWFEENNTVEGARSYGTATADGLCGLITCGISESDARATAAIAWLQRNDGVSAVPGFSADDNDIPFAEDGLKFYYYAALASGIHKTPNAGWSKQRRLLLETMIQQQGADGSWSNACALMREDDPLIATSLAALAMSLLAETNDVGGSPH